MARCYSGAVPKRHSPLPALWLISDARNDAVLEAALEQLPRGSGLVFRHYHLPPAERRHRFRAILRIARQRGHCAVLAGTAHEARAWGADGAYGSPGAVARGPNCLRLVTVHSLNELARARRADAVLLSPVFPTRSHPGAVALGPLRFRLIARHARVAVIALGGMTARRARALGSAWAAIDGLSTCDATGRRGRFPRILDADSPQGA